VIANCICNQRIAAIEELLVKIEVVESKWQVGGNLKIKEGVAMLKYTIKKIA